MLLKIINVKGEVIFTQYHPPHIPRVGEKVDSNVVMEVVYSFHANMVHVVVE